MASDFTAEFGESICELIADGKSIRFVANLLQIPESNIRFWIKKYPDFAAQYAQAREDRANGWAEEFIEIADSIELTEDAADNRAAIELAKLRLDARKWVVSRILSKVYGEKVTHSGDADNPIGLQIVSSIPRPDRTLEE
jgi:hypothetical protein